LVDNIPAAPTGKVSLSNCRAHGPSYRLLPRRVRSQCQSRTFCFKMLTPYQQ
jgi:histone deacetylase complex regulatory component SIN3